MFNKRQKITIATPFPVFPPTNIHSKRIFYFYSHLAQEFDLEIVSFADSHANYFQGAIAPGLIEIRIPKTTKQQELEINLKQKLGSGVGNASLIKYYSLTPDYLKTLKKSAKDADFLITYQPYLFSALREVSDKPIWYEASGIETELKKQVLPNNDLGHEFWELIYETEKQCCQSSNLIITCSDYDAQQLNNIYDLEESKIVCISNGIESSKINYISYEQRLLNKEKLGLKESFIAIYTGTGSPYNANEARCILNIASKLPEINFLILGDVATSFEPRLTPPNVGIMGNIDPSSKSIILELADLALNPVTSPSDTLPIILEYFCRGVPVLSTPLGVKNIGAEHDKHCLIGEVWRFPEMLLFASQEDPIQKKIRLKNAQKYAVNNFAWQRIANKFFQKFRPWSLFY